MVDKIIRTIIAVVIGFVLYWGLSLIVTALASAVAFAYTGVALAIIAGLLIIGVCVYVAQLWGISI
jgi:hypothetical protein